MYVCGVFVCASVLRCVFPVGVVAYVRFNPHPQQTSSNTKTTNNTINLLSTPHFVGKVRFEPPPNIQNFNLNRPALLAPKLHRSFGLSPPTSPLLILYSLFKSLLFASFHPCEPLRIRSWDVKRVKLVISIIENYV